MIVRTVGQLAEDRWRTYNKTARTLLELLLHKWPRKVLPNSNCRILRIFQMDPLDWWVLEYEDAEGWERRRDVPWEDRPPVRMMLVDRPIWVKFT